MSTVSAYTTQIKKRNGKQYTTFLFIVLFTKICPISELNIRHIIPFLKLKYQAKTIDNSEFFF